MRSSKPVELEIASSIEQLRDGVASFADGWRRNPETMRKLQLFLRAKHWIHDPLTGWFANVKFAGYRGMNVHLYSEAAKARSRASISPTSQIKLEGGFTGGINTPIAKKFGAWQKNRALAKELSELIDRVDGPDTSARIKTDKWWFLQLPESNASEIHSHVRGVIDDIRVSVVELEAIEGGRELRQHFVIERNKALVVQLKKKWLKSDPELQCEICGFSFLREYGDLGRAFIEAHHKESLSKRKHSEITLESDFEAVCSNCHQMLHRRPVVQSDELRTIIQRAKR